MGAQLAPQPLFQAFGPNGKFLVGGQLFTFAAGTSTPQATYVDFSQTTPNTNPVILNAMGQANVWLDPSLMYKFVLQDASGNLLYSLDNINGALSVAVINVGVTSPPIPFGGGSVASFNGGPTSFAGPAVVIAGGTNPNNIALAVASRSNGEALTVNGQNVTGQSLGMTVIAGTTNADVNSTFFSASGTTQYVTIAGDGGLIIGPIGTADLGPGTVNASGLIKGGSLTVTGVAATGAMTITGTLSTTGAASIGGALTVTGAAGINGATAQTANAGWGTPTSPVVINNFSGTAATTLQIQGAIAQIITVLKAFGLLGA